MPGIPFVGGHQEVYMEQITGQNLSYQEINGAVIVIGESVVTHVYHKVVLR